MKIFSLRDRHEHALMGKFGCGLGLWEIVAMKILAEGWGNRNDHLRDIKHIEDGSMGDAFSMLRTLFLPHTLENGKKKTKNVYTEKEKRHCKCGALSLVTEHKWSASQTPVKVAGRVSLLPIFWAMYWQWSIWIQGVQSIKKHQRKNKIMKIQEMGKAGAVMRAN